MGWCYSRVSPQIIEESFGAHNTCHNGANINTNTEIHRLVRVPSVVVMKGIYHLYPERTHVNALVNFTLYAGMRGNHVCIVIRSGQVIEGRCREL